MVETEARVSKNFLRVIVDPEEPSVDIVAVHGLNPTNTEFHAESTWTAGDKLWLRDFLPKQLPNARVLLFGYNSNVAFETSTAGVREQAENLLNRLKAKRRGAPDRPLIFVCHSLGGIIVKRALVHAKLDDSYSSIPSATYGIVFFGTPHQGGNGAKLGDIAASIARGLLRNPENTFLEALKADSLFADDLVQDFRQQLEDYYVLSFYETRPMGKLGLIVDKKSATLGLPTLRETQIAMDADHSNVCKFLRIDGDDYEQVADSLVDLAERAIGAFTEQQRMKALSAPTAPLISEQTSRIFMVPYTSNPDFVGREGILEQLKSQLGASHGNKQLQAQVRVALFGLGGAGKSQIAIEYAYWVRDEFPGTSVFWIHASNADRFRQALSQIGLECKIAGTEDPKADTLKLVKAWLQSNRCGRWLMIIDSADNSEMFFEPGGGEPQNSRVTSQTALRPGLGSNIPECSHGSILVTTRNKQAGVKLTRNRGLIQVAEMNREESIELIRRRIEQASIEDDDIAILTDHLGNLPLTLVQAAAFIQENSISISDYLGILQTSDDAKVHLLSQPFEEMGRDSKIPNAVTATWMISFKQVKEQHPRAANLLSLMTYFDRQEIPKSLLSQQVEDSLEMEKALGVLKAYSFITASNQRQSFNMHRLIQLVMRKWLEIEGEAKRWAKDALVTIADLFSVGQYQNWKICATYLPHSIVVLDYSGEDDIYRAGLLHLVALYLVKQGQSKKAEQLLIQAVEVRKRILGPEHPDTLLSLSNLSSVYRNLRQLNKAEQLGMQVSEISKRVLGPEHPDTLSSLSNLSLVYRSLEQLNKAEQLGMQLSEVSKRILGPEHPDTLVSLGNLSLLYRDLGQLNKAEQLGMQVSEVSKRVLGPEHPGTLVILSNLSSVYRDLRQLNKAEQLGMQVSEVRKRVLGPEHPNTLISLDKLASVYRDLGQLNHAEQLEMQVLEVRKRVQGPEHPDTLLSLANLAHTWKALDRMEDATSLMLEAVRLSKIIMGPDHTRTRGREQRLKEWQDESLIQRG